MMRRWISLGLLFVLVLTGCIWSDQSQAKRTVDGYMQEIQQGNFEEAEQYCSKEFNKTSSLSSYKKTVDTIAKESNYSENEKEAFEQ